MKKIVLTFAAFAATATSFAGGLLTNTNQHAAFLRNPARQGIIGIEGVYTNPAGVAFMPQGFHLGVTWQAAMQKRQLSVNNPLFMKNANNQSASRYYEGKATAPVIPSIQAAYVINDKWSVSANFAVAGGGGKCEFEQGLPMFEELVYSVFNTALSNTPTGFQNYSFNQSLTGEQYFYGLQLGATYKVTENFSVFGGVRGILANSIYSGNINNIKVNGLGAAEYKGAAEKYAASGMAADAEGAQSMAFLTSDYKLDCEQNAIGFQPIIGANLKLGKLNIGAKYEFRAKINLENESNNSQNLIFLATEKKVTEIRPFLDGESVRSDIPALFTIGAQYEITDNIRAMAGVNYYFDKDAKGSATAVSDDTYEITLGGEWDINDKWTVGLGGQRTKYGFAAADMKDTNFNISSYGLCVGGAYKFSEKLKLNFGYMHTFYEDHKFEKVLVPGKLNAACNYTRKNDVVGVSLDFKF